MKDSKIAWTHHTFNPWWGCVKVSPGCKNCYAETFAKRTGNQVWGVDAPRRFFGQKHWSEPLKWNIEAGQAEERRRVFCASMADVFEIHREPETQEQMNTERKRLAWVIRETQNLDWLLLTKRIETAAGYLERMFPFQDIPSNLWIGTTCENQEQAIKRIPHLMSIPASVRFISVEPQLDLVTLPALNKYMPDWVICGGESGPGCRPFNPDWARSLRDQCSSAGVSFFMKQLGGHPHKRDQMEDLPEDLRVREFPR